MRDRVTIDIRAEPPGGLDPRFCEVMDAAPVMIWVSARDTVCTWFNRPWLTFTGRSMAQELGNGWTEGVHRDDFDRCLNVYLSHFDARAGFRMQYRLRRHDGNYRWIDDTGIPRHAHDGTFLGYIGSCIDIHEQRETEAESRRRLLDIAHLNRRADAVALVAAIAHGLNQPLAAILSNAEAAAILLDADPPRLDLVRDILADIGRDDQRAARAITHMRELLKVNGLDVQETDVNDAVAVVGDIIAPQAVEMGIALSIDRSERDFGVRANAIYLQQVLLNLALNGMDAMVDVPPGERRMLLRTVMVAGSAVEVAVSDSGSGIPAEELEHIFEPFFTTKRHGTGLGLAIARGIIETYGGRIWGENRTGGGAVFRFNLPLARPPA
jgi:PAS domain S-box-containing protein